MIQTTFFTPRPHPLNMFDSPKRGRPALGAIDRMRAKAWYRFMAHKTGATTPNRLGELFDVEDTNLFRKYKLGRSVPDKYVKKAERLAPGSRAILQEGPRGLFAVMSGDVEACWLSASVFEDDGSEFVGRHLPLELSVLRMTTMVAAEIENGVRHEFAHFVQMVALWRIQNEAAKLFGVEQEGLFELIFTMTSRSPAIQSVLRAFAIGEDVLDWISEEQLRRLILDPMWRVAVDKWEKSHEGDVWDDYLADPLHFVASTPSLHARHPYLDAMPATLSSLATRSSARKCV